MTGVVFVSKEGEGHKALLLQHCFCEGDELTVVSITPSLNDLVTLCHVIPFHHD